MYHISNKDIELDENNLAVHAWYKFASGGDGVQLDNKSKVYNNVGLVQKDKKNSKNI